MPKIENWSVYEGPKRKGPKRAVIKMWQNDDEPHKMVQIVSETAHPGMSGHAERIYFVNDYKPSQDRVLAKRDTQKSAKKYARKWMASNPNP